MDIIMQNGLNVQKCIFILYVNLIKRPKYRMLLVMVLLFNASGSHWSMRGTSMTSQITDVKEVFTF